MSSSTAPEVPWNIDRYNQLPLNIKSYVNLFRKTYLTSDQNESEKFTTLVNKYTDIQLNIFQH